MSSLMICRIALTLILLCGLLPGLSSAQEPDDATRESAAAPPPAIAIKRTEHDVVVDGQSISYTASAGTLPIPPGEEPPKAEIFHVAYTKKGAAAEERPVTFVFNGGPGAAAVYLHLGALGPWRLATQENGRAPPPPGRLEANPWTWLTFTDLVFIDPVGTGYSRAVGEQRRNRGGERAFWNVEADLDSLSDFIRLWLTRYDRWASPKFLVGESYGGFRAAFLADELQSTFELTLNGIILVSPALEMDLLRGDGFDLLPWVLRVPSFTAVAQAHGKAATNTVTDAEAFATGALLSGLARGAALPADEAAKLAERLADYVGLPIDLVDKHDLRIPTQVFVSRLLEKQGQVISTYDGSIADPAPPTVRERPSDGELQRLSAALSTAFASYAQSELGVVTDLPYHVLSGEVSRRWDWAKRGAGDRLASALERQPHLSVLVAHGRHDLVTPYLGSTYVLNQMHLAPRARRNVTIVTYDGGHMFYTRPTSLEAFHHDAAALYAGAAMR